MGGGGIRRFYTILRDGAVVARVPAGSAERALSRWYTAMTKTLDLEGERYRDHCGCEFALVQVDDRIEEYLARPCVWHLTEGREVDGPTSLDEYQQQWDVEVEQHGPPIKNVYRVQEAQGDAEHD